MVFFTVDSPSARLDRKEESPIMYISFASLPVLDLPYTRFASYVVDVQGYLCTLMSGLGREQPCKLKGPDRGILALKRQGVSAPQAPLHRLS